MLIRRLSPSDVTDYRRLRLRGLRESPAAFGSSYSEEVRQPLKAFGSRVKQTNFNWAFGAFEGDRLVAVLNLSREERRKLRHRASIFGMYVTREFRRKGIGRALLEQAIETSRKLRGLRQIGLTVVESNRSAVRLYKAFGFRVFGREKTALCVSGRFYVILYLSRRL